MCHPRVDFDSHDTLIHYIHVYLAGYELFYFLCGSLEGNTDFNWSIDVHHLWQKKRVSINHKINKGLNLNISKKIVSYTTPLCIVYMLVIKRQLTIYL